MTLQLGRPAPATLVLDSPVGPLTLRAEDGFLVGLRFPDWGNNSGGARAVPDDPMGGASPPDGPVDGASTPTDGDPDAGTSADRAVLAEARAQLTAYFEHRLTRFDLPLRLDGTTFQRQVWQALQEIPYGETVSYGWVAHRVGQPTAARAVGLANGRNPVAVVVPCHRVIGASGRLTGYGGGLDRKEHLLALERTAAVLF